MGVLEELHQVTSSLYEQSQAASGAKAVDALQAQQELLIERARSFFDKEEALPSEAQSTYRQVVDLQKKVEANLTIRKGLLFQEIQQIKRARKKLKEVRDRYAGKSQLRKQIDTRS